MIIWAVCVMTFGYRANFFVSLLTVIFGTGVLIPGLGICSWRLSRHSQQFRREMVGRHFMSMRQELARARNIHESMFPKHYADPHVEFDYTYLPMRELGGDFIHLNVGAQGLVHVVLLDVTGHGLAAALTVATVLCPWMKPNFTFGPAVLVLVVLLASLWLNGYYYAELTITSASLLVASGVMAWILQIIPLAKQSSWKTTAIRLVPALVPLAVAVILAALDFAKELKSSV